MTSPGSANEAEEHPLPSVRSLSICWLPLRAFRLSPLRIQLRFRSPSRGSTIQPPLSLSSCNWTVRTFRVRGWMKMFPIPPVFFSLSPGPLVVAPSPFDPRYHHHRGTTNEEPREADQKPLCQRKIVEHDDTTQRTVESTKGQRATNILEQASTNFTGQPR